jgi:hypothetical protein
VRNLNHQLKQLCRRNRDGSYSTQATRERLLTRVANELHELGFRGLQARSLKPKHVEALTARWLEIGLSTGTIKNRMIAIRWWAEKIDKRNVVARDNSHYAIPDRSLVVDRSKALRVDEFALAQVKDQYVHMSLRLQAVFGLRREEAIKFSPSYADRGHELRLKASWTKGGKERVIPIRTAEQRQILNEARALAGRGSMIPSHKNYKAQLRVYERHGGERRKQRSLLQLHALHEVITITASEIIMPHHRLAAGIRANYQRRARSSLQCSQTA